MTYILSDPSLQHANSIQHFVNTVQEDNTVYGSSTQGVSLCIIPDNSCPLRLYARLMKTEPSSESAQKCTVQSLVHLSERLLTNFDRGPLNHYLQLLRAMGNVL